MKYAVAGGAILDADYPAETLLERIIKRIKEAAKWLKDTLNQRGEP